MFCHMIIIFKLITCVLNKMDCFSFLTFSFRIKLPFFSSARGSVLTSNDCNETHKLFDYLASRLATKWRDLGIYLHVPSHELDKIEAQYSQPASNKSPALELLFAWRSQTRVETEYQRIATLQDALRKIHRNDIVGLIDRGESI